MKNINVFSYALAGYKIKNINVDIYFAPAVLDSYFSKEEVTILIENDNKQVEAFDEIFKIIKNQIEEHQTYEIWYDRIEYGGIELIWNSRYYEKRKTMFVEVFLVEETNNSTNTIH